MATTPVGINWRVYGINQQGKTVYTTKSFIPYAASMPIARAGDSFGVESGYTFVLRAYNDPIADQEHYYGSYPEPAAYVEGSVEIPDYLIGKYIAPVVKRTDEADIVLSTDRQSVSYLRSSDVSGIRSINSNPIVVGTSGIEDMSITDNKTTIGNSIMQGLASVVPIDMNWRVKTINQQGNAVVSSKAFIPYAASLPVAESGDFFYVNDGYSVVLRAYNEPIVDSGHYYGSYPDPAYYVEGSIGIPDSLAGKYIAPVVRRVDGADIVLSTDRQNVSYVRTSNLASLDDFGKESVILDGKFDLPEEFGDMPFSIVRLDGRYDIDVPHDEIVSDPTVVFVVDSSTETGPGTDAEHPITLERFRTNRNNNVYPTDNVKVKFLEGSYFLQSVPASDLMGTSNTIANIEFEGCDDGITWIGVGMRSPVWTQHVDSIFMTTSASNVTDLVNLNETKPDGMPCLYVKVSDISMVTHEGLFAQNGESVYVWPHNGDASGISLVYGTSYTSGKKGVITIRRTNVGSTVFDRMGFLHDSLNMRDLRSDNTGWYYFFGCRFHRGSQDSLSLNGAYKALLVDCGADYGSKDCFNYHSSSKDSVAIELSCFAYGAGLAKSWDVSGSNTTTDSNNASTAHDGMCVARFGCSYWDCEGAICADVNNVVTYNQEVSCKSIAETIGNADYKAAFMLHDNTGVTSPNRTDTHDNFIIGCLGGGHNVDYGFRVIGMPVKVSGYKGVSSINAEGVPNVQFVSMVV